MTGVVPKMRITPVCQGLESEILLADFIQYSFWHAG